MGEILHSATAKPKSIAEGEKPQSGKAKPKSIAEGEKPQSGKVKPKKYIAEGDTSTFHSSLLSLIWKSRPDIVEKREERRDKR